MFLEGFRKTDAGLAVISNGRKIALRSSDQCFRSLRDWSDGHRCRTTTEILRSLKPGIVRSNRKVGLDDFGIPCPATSIPFE